MSKEQKLIQAICNRLYIGSKGSIRLEPSQIRSSRKALEDSSLEKIKGLKSYFDEFEKCVTFIDSIKHPTGIYKFMEDYAHTHGKIHTKKVEFSKGNETHEHEIFDYYVPDDKDEYVIIIVDHAALLSEETGLSKHGTISKLSSEYFVKLRNRYKYIPVLIQQQASSQESIENFKSDMLKPSLAGLGECKLTQRDADVIMGLFSPMRHKIKKYPENGGYNIEFFRDNIRFLEIIAAREGGSNNVSPLFFDGKVNYFKELPLPSDPAIKRVEERIKKNRIEDERYKKRNKI